MIINTLKALFHRDLNKLISEVKQYKSESDIWKINGQINNSAGNLCLHLVGNLNTYIGRELGKTGYVRNRELEFSSKDISRQELIQMVENTIEMINQTLDHFDENLLDKRAITAPIIATAATQPITIPAIAPPLKPLEDFLE